MANEDLSEFRKNWLKELEKRNKNVTEKPKTSTSASTSSAQQQHSSHHFEPGTVALDIKSGLSLSIPEKRPVLDAAEIEGRFQNERKHKDDEYRQPELQIRDVYDGDADASATYYPFRILTTLLNRASTEEAPKPKRRKRSSGVGDSESPSQSGAAAATPKRAYFSDKDSQGGHGAPLPLEKRKEESEGGRKTCGGDGETDSKDYLDLFIADLNEISEIPFFDVSLPREVAVKIFRFLDTKDLCRCAQVSRSWRSLAEDELLWCGICHRLGFEMDTLTVGHSDWKSRVRHHVTIRHSLELNWKGRIGKLHNLHHAKGGVLCAVHSQQSTIVAGYSSCRTKLWNVVSGETVIFQPSSTALIIDESEDEGTLSNEVLHVATCPSVTAASYTHGFVDVWSNEKGTEPVYTFTLAGPGVQRQPTSLQLLEGAHSNNGHSSSIEAYLAVSFRHQVQVHSIQRDEEDGSSGSIREIFQFDSTVKSTKWLQDSTASAMKPSPSSSSSSLLSSSSVLKPTLCIATTNTVSLVTLFDRESSWGCGPSSSSSCSYAMQEVHNIVDAPVTCVDARTKPEQVVVGFTLNTGPCQYFRVDVYDLLTRQMTLTLADHTACVLCVNMADSPPHQLVTGSRDRKVRVFDTRVSRSALMTLMGHSAAVTTVQMDEWKVVSGDEAGFVCVWDQRMAKKLWEMNNRHPVRYCRFEDRQLVVGHVPYVKQHYSEFDFDTGLHQRHRGSLHVYDFLADQMTQGVPEICLSSYDEPQGYNYNITLAVPYDQL